MNNFTEQFKLKVNSFNSKQINLDEKYEDDLIFLKKKRKLI